jgi:hydrogenase maturation protein HypF
MRCTVRGIVQGVGFRPFIYRLAHESQLTGFVLNTPSSVLIEVEGEKAKLDEFLLRVGKEKPTHSFIQSLEVSFLDCVGYRAFVIRESNGAGERDVIVPADIATCRECLAEIFDEKNRRYLYPFTNCTHCGPRFSIIEALPYDRGNTTMKIFTMCDACRREYDDPLDRRFHAQPNACPHCGPSLQYWAGGMLKAMHHDALLCAAEKIRDGRIVAVKGLGGFHLLVDARNDDAVRRLRQRKHREAKPLAAMFPSLASIQQVCEVSEHEERLLMSAESPIVLLKRGSNLQASLADSIAPNNPFLGAMLPYTPLHHILLRELGFPVVATSGNISDEPICIDEREAFERLKNVADVFLVHNRPIVRHVDDSVVRIMLGREQVIRRARGYAPLPIVLQRTDTLPCIAVGAHQKNVVAISKRNNIVMSQHIGDLETSEALDAFHHVVDSVQQLFEFKPTMAAADLHPDYASTKFAHRLGVNVVQIQHHYAHILSCMAENELDGRVLGVAWDGTGYGLDGTIWGGEFLLADRASFERVATFREFSLPGGEKAIKEPRRAALGLLYELFGDAVLMMKEITTVAAFTETELKVLRQMLLKNLHSPRTTSVGRLFDALASIADVRQAVSFEGQAAMELEFAMHDKTDTRVYGYDIVESRNKSARWCIDWSQMIASVLHDVFARKPISYVSATFHNTLVEIIVDVAKRIGEHRVVLSGGCFQNRYLTEQAVVRLRQEGFRPYWHQRVPPNDGGIALGQMYGALHVHAKPLAYVESHPSTLECVR